MGNWLSKFGAKPSRDTRYGVLWNGRFSTGQWTQRSPLRDAGSTRLEEEFYGARGDALLSGLNCEVSPKLTFIRRPGTSVYNSSTFPGINRFYEFKPVINNKEQIRVVADVQGSPGTVRNVTGPNTNSTYWTKAANAAITSFQGVGNTLYFSDGVNANKIVESPITWTPNTSLSTGQFVVDSNGNLELAIGGQTATITNILVSSNVCTIFFSASTPLEIPTGTSLTFGTGPNAPTTIPSLAGTTQVVTSVPNSLQVQFSFVHADVGYTTETGTVTTGTGITGSSQPTWSLVTGAITIDGGAQWENKGSQVEMWGIVAPTTAPSVTQTLAPTAYPVWTANTWYAPLFVILDTNGNLQQLTSTGSAPHQTGGSTPTWNVTVGGTTTDGDITWTNLGPDAWMPSTVYAVGAVIQATYSYWITEFQYSTDDNGNPVYSPVQVLVTTTSIFKCTVGGTSGTTTPGWTNGLGTATTESTGVVWVNQSTSAAPSWPGATQILSLATAVLDSNNNIQKPTLFGESGAGPITAVPWQTALGSYTSDNLQLWLNSGPFGAANTGAWIYAYSFKNSITGGISTASPQSAPITVTINNLAVIQGVGSTDPQVDTIVLWRTVQGGSTLFFLDEIPNPGAGNWIYTDTTADVNLDEEIEAPINDVNDPPPAGLLALTYHLGRIWGAVNNLVYYSTGPDTTAGNGNEAWSPSNVFSFPDTVTRLFPMSAGLLVFTVSDIYIIQGLGTASSALFSAPFLEDIGLVSWDAFAVNGSILYLYTSDNQIITLDPSSGVSEIGFPIGDQFGPGLGTGTFNPSSAHVTWHIAGSQDKGLYVSDFNGIWWRECPTPSPESGTTWSPKAQIVNGFSVVQSIEVLPGTHELLIGPKTNGPILKRDYTVYNDNSLPYPARATLGSMVLAQPGQLATVDSFTTDSVATGTPISLAVQIDEIAPYMGLATASIANSGTGYVIGDIVSGVYFGAFGGLLKVLTVSGSGAVTSLVLIQPGEGYPVTASGLPTSGGTGSGLTLNTTNVNYFETLSDYVPDPTQLEPSVSTYAQRFYLSQTQKPAVCRHLQVLVDWGMDEVKNEMLAISLFGSFDQER